MRKKRPGNFLTMSKSMIIFIRKEMRRAMREAMIKAMRKAIGSLLLLVLLLVNTLPANGANSPDTSQKYEVYVLNSFSGEMMGTVSDLVFSYRDIGFNYL